MKKSNESSKSMQQTMLDIYGDIQKNAPWGDVVESLEEALEEAKSLAEKEDAAA